MSTKISGGQKMEIAYNIRRTGEVIGISRSFVYGLIAEGHLEARKVGRRTVVTAESIRRFIETRPVACLGAKKAG